MLKLECDAIISDTENGTQLRSPEKLSAFCVAQVFTPGYRRAVEFLLARFTGPGWRLDDSI